MRGARAMESPAIPGLPRSRPGEPRWLGPAAVTGSLLPAVGLLVAAVRGALGANPIAEALNALGLLALVLLVASLACTPLRWATGIAWIQPLRRTFGLLGFAYAAAHLVVYVVVDQGLALGALAKDVLSRPFITVGMLAFALLVPLAWTSTRARMAALGGARWRRLHKLAYLAAPIAAAHFVLRVKKDRTEPLVYAAVVVALLAVRAARRARSG
jgi:sulfoxide reductase heme-binding subunit YedZ